MAGLILVLLIVYFGLGIYVEFTLQSESSKTQDKEFKMVWDWNEILTWPKNIKKMYKD